MGQADGAGHVNFRLDGYYLVRLETGATARGMGRGEYARFLLLQALEQQAAAGESAGTEEAGDPAGAVRELRADLANAVYVLLVAAGNQEPAKAQEWVRKNLLTR